MSIRYDLPRGQFFDEEDRYVNPGTVAEKLEQAEAALAAAVSEAQTWKQEATIQRATVWEAYQAITGATGEPGDWHGAEPVKAIVAALAAERERLMWMAAQRSSFHLTYHGGYHDADNLAAFQHGMDTVFNWLRDLAARPAPEEELPADLNRVLHDQSVIVEQDAAVFEQIAKWQNAPSNTASGPAPEEET